MTCKRSLLATLLLAFIALWGLVSQSPAQQKAPAPITGSDSVVPGLMRFSGSLRDSIGKPITDISGVTFLVYKDEQGGAPLWMETQNVQPDNSGRYSVVLGSSASGGLPADVFASGEPRWLGVLVSGQSEQPRVQLLSVPYALKAQDAETLGGKPLSAFLTVEQLQSGQVQGHNHSQGSVQNNLSGTGTANYVPVWQNSTTLGNSSIYNSAGNVGIGTISPAASLDVNGTTDLRNTLTLFPKAASPVLAVSGKAFRIASTGLVTFAAGQTFPGAASLGANAFGAQQTISSGDLSLSNGNIDLPLTSSATVGVITMGGQPFMHAYSGSAINNTFLGNLAGNFTLTGGQNTGIGALSLVFNTTGQFNTAAGWGSLNSNTTGTSNTAVGSNALGVNTIGVRNTAEGDSALMLNDQGNANVAVGSCALNNTTITGGNYKCQTITPFAASGNTALGTLSGQSNTSGTRNTFLGFRADAGSGALTNATAIGANALVTANNSLVLGSITGINGAVSNTNVGIGVTAPAHALDVAGDINTAGHFLGDGSLLANLPPATTVNCSGCIGNSQLGVMYAASSSQGGAASNALALNGMPAGSFATLSSNTFTGNQLTNGSVVVDSSGSNNGGSLPGLQFGGTGSGEAISSNRRGYGTPNQDGLDFYTNNQARFSVLNSGQVGINTQTPQMNAQFESDGGFGCIGSKNHCPLGVNGAPGANFNGGVNDPSVGGGGLPGLIATGGFPGNFGLTGGGGIGAIITGGEGNVGNGGDGLDVYQGLGSVNRGLAAYFAGDVHIDGTVEALYYAGFGSDDPTDPANKSLHHAGVGSSELLNLYTGNVTTDANGNAVVQLPSWFEALNGDFRYQLTVVGKTFARAIVANEISNNQFTILTDQPNVKVSWQVTGVRHDATALAHPLQVEVEKNANERGFYHDPKAYGAPEEKQIQFARHPELLTILQTVRKGVKPAPKN